MSIEETSEVAAVAEQVVLQEEEEDMASVPLDDDHGADEEVDMTNGKMAGRYNAHEVNEEIFEELHLGEAVASEVLNTWNAFLSSAENREAAGEAIYSAVFDAAPSLQHLFKTPRAVMALRLMNGVNQIINSLSDPKGLKVITETLGFQHMDFEVTVPRVTIFRDAIVDLLQVELGTDIFRPKAKDGWCIVLNYIGGAMIYVRTKYAERLKCIAASWAEANGQKPGDLDNSEEGAEEDGGEMERADTIITEEPEEMKVGESAKTKGKGWFGGGAKGAGAGDAAAGNNAEKGVRQNTSVPKNYSDMFTFNAAVMGFGGRAWMNEVLASFDAIVSNVANSYRLQEECDVLALRMAKYKGDVKLSEYKAVMLASLRSLVKEWASQHEVAWSWLWENVERMLRKLHGRPAKLERSLTNFLSGLDEASLMTIRQDVFTRFFALAPAGQDFFKQSATRLYFIADKLVAMTLDMYRDPKRMVEDISAVGLRHVGYGVPTDLLGPFVTAWVQVIRSLTDDELPEEAFRWSLSLISRILTRVITEGSTIVMKAVTVNSGKQLNKAIACAPRGERASWMLKVQVGTQSISPLMWAIESSSLDAAKAIIVDLLTIRADRDRYYYGMDIMFERHPDIIKRLSVDAPALLPVLLDGLIWRARQTEGGRRRVNYYIKHLIVDGEGRFAPAIEWITESRDPKIVCHPVIAVVTDLVWEGVAFRTFFQGKMWFFFTLIIFVLSQSVLNNLHSEDGVSSPEEVRVSIFACRCFTYLFSLGRLIYHHAKSCLRCVRAKEFVRIGGLRLPGYLSNWQECAGVVMILLLGFMFCTEPILHCLPSTGKEEVIQLTGVDAEDPLVYKVELFSRDCEAASGVIWPYSIASAAATLVYFLLLSDLSVLSTHVSAYALVCFRVLPELVLFLFGLSFFVVAFACAVSSLEHASNMFSGIPKAGLQFYKITFGMFSGSHYDVMGDHPTVLVATFAYVVTTSVFLLNLLVAQLNSAYQDTYQDMLGFARLNRGKIVTETMPSVTHLRWERFVASLRLDEPVEFGEGDIGLKGGLQMQEPASANPILVDEIRRFGGSTSPMAEWPEENLPGNEEEDRYDRMEKLMERAMKRMAGGKKGKNGSFASGSVRSSSDAGSVASDTQ